MIWLLGTALALVTVAGLAAPWWWDAFARRVGLRRRAANVAAYRGRLAELEADAASGVLPADAIDAAREELAARLVEDADEPQAATLEARASRGLLALLVVGVLGFAFAWYAAAGSWRTQALVERAKTDPAGARAAAVDGMIESLREQVAQTPNDAEAWAWLARSLRERGDLAAAADAFGRASAIKGQQDPDLLVEEGEALAHAANRVMTGAPAQRFAQALALAPDHPQALWFAGLAALQAGDERGTIGYWERLVRQPLPEATRATLEHSLAQLRGRNDIAPPKGPAAPVPTLTLDVRLAPDLAGDVQPGDALFVYAAEAGGPPMPLAVKRLTAAALPARVTLDDRDSMIPSRPLSSVARWRVTARLSRSGNATPQSGDLEGVREVDRAQAGAPTRLVIDRRRP